MTEKISVIGFEQHYELKSKMLKSREVRLINLNESANKNEFDEWSVVSIDHNYRNYQKCSANKVCLLAAKVSLYNGF